MCLEKLGAYSFVDFATSKNVVKDVQAQTEDGLGPHAVILVAVNEKPFQQAAEVCFATLTPRTESKINITIVRPPTRNRHLHRSPSWRLPPRTCLRVRHQDGHHQGILRRKPTRYRRGS
jgi:hypothetical protein